MQNKKKKKDQVKVAEVCKIKQSLDFMLKHTTSNTSLNDRDAFFIFSQTEYRSTIREKYQAFLKILENI